MKDLWKVTVSHIFNGEIYQPETFYVAAPVGQLKSTIIYEVLHNISSDDSDCQISISLISKNVIII